MNAKLIRRPARAFSLIDLLILVGTVVLVALALLPSMIASSRPKPQRITCINNLKQIGLSFRLWAGDNGDKYPAQVSTNAGGSMEWVSFGQVPPHFAVMSNELNTPLILVCPEDRWRKAAANFGALTAANLSYFMVPEADESLPQLWLAGDRNLATNGKALKPGLFTVRTNAALGWTSELHRHNGNLALADGSVRTFSSAGLAPSATNALAAYFAATSNATFRILLP